MKRISVITRQNLTLLALSFCLTMQSLAQAPQKFNYQGIARDAQGNPMSKQQLSIKLSVLPTQDATVPEYEETQWVSTNEFGLYTLQIGAGTAITGEMKTVKWETGNKYIRVSIDPKGGQDFMDAGTTQLLSVPYALYADKAGEARESVGSSHQTTRASNNFIEKTSATGVANSNSLLFDNGTNIGLNTTSPLARFHVNGTTGSTTEIRLQHSAATGSSRFAFFADNGTSFTTTNDYTVMNKYTAGTTGTLTPGFPIRSLYAFSNSKGSLFFTSAANVGFGQWNPVTNTYSTRLFVDSATGNVGIGNVAPQARLDISGQIRINGGAPGAGKVLTSDANGLATWQTPAASGIGGSGTLNFVPRFTPSGTVLGNSTIFDNGTRVGIGTIAPISRVDVADATTTHPAILSGRYTGSANSDIVGVLGSSVPTDGWGIGVDALGGYRGVRGYSSFGAGLRAMTDSGTALFATTGLNGAYGGFFQTLGGIGVFSSTDSLAAGDFTSSGVSPDFINGVLRAEHTANPNTMDYSAISGVDTATSGWGVGVRGLGGYIGLQGIGENYGVVGSGSGPLGYGVFGSASAGIGVWGSSNTGVGVDGYSFTGSAISGYSPQGIGLSAGSDSNSAGYFYSGSSNFSTSLSTDGVVFGEYTGTSVQDAIGVHGLSTPPSSVYGIGVKGTGNWYGVMGTNPSGSGYAGYFSGLLYANSATSGIKAFRIDHPQDPANKYLYHSSVESNDMMNIYNGNVTTDAQGEAVVTLPSYFEDLNVDFKYQLTVIGTFAQAIIAEEIQQNQFTIKTSQPNVKVSWQVTGVRNDALAKAHRIQVEVEKPGREKGLYQNPVEHGVSPELGISYQVENRKNLRIGHQALREQQEKDRSELNRRQQLQASIPPTVRPAKPNSDRETRE